MSTKNNARERAGRRSCWHVSGSSCVCGWYILFVGVCVIRVCDRGCIRVSGGVLSGCLHVLGEFSIVC